MSGETKVAAATEIKAAESEAASTSNGYHDVVTHRIVVASLGLTVLFTCLDMTILQCLGKEVPPAMNNLGATAIVALVTTLSSIMRPR